VGIGVVREPENVSNPGADKGIRLRSPAMSTFQYVLEDLGYEPVTVTYAEVPTAMRTHSVDGWVGGTPNMNYAWVGDIINRMYINYISAEATCYVISEKSLAKLSGEDRQTVIDVFREQSIRSFREADENEEKYKRKLQDDYGVQITELSRDEIDANAEYVRDVTWSRLEEILTPELIAGFRAEVEKLNQ
jgi:TRAP-type C4-dicarboxylate transport system substrate-binding protein